MRIIAGSLGGRLIKAPPSGPTKPMSEKLRGALFSALGDISKMSILDAFSGSGAIALESYSRGAKSVVAVDSSAVAVSIIKANAVSLNVYGAELKVVNADIGRWADYCESKFDLIIADPPYNKPQPDAVSKLSRLLNPNGHLVLSWPPKTQLPNLTNLELLKTKKYGDASLTYFCLVRR
jgi:16S rRNA (guanine966-N2)-methyltransferase